MQVYHTSLNIHALSLNWVSSNVAPISVRVGTTELYQLIQVVTTMRDVVLESACMAQPSKARRFENPRIDCRGEIMSLMTGHLDESWLCEDVRFEPQGDPSKMSGERVCNGMNGNGMKQSLDETKQTWGD